MARIPYATITQFDELMRDIHFPENVALTNAFRYNPDDARCLYFLGLTRLQQGRLADAEPVLQRALRHFEEAEWSEAGDATKARRNRATALCNLAALHINQGRFAEADLLCRDALAIFRSDDNTRALTEVIAFCVSRAN